MGAAGMAGVAGGVAGVVAATVAVKAYVDAITAGSGRAMEMARELSTLDESARATALESMGPLGKIIDENSPALLRFSDNAEKAIKTLDDMWTAAGARVVPSLEDVLEVAASIDLTSLGTQIGEVTGGLVYLATDAAKAAVELSTADEKTQSWTKALIGFNPVLAKAGSNIADFFKTYGDGAELDRAFDPDRIKALEAARLENVRKSQDAIAKVREDAERTSEERLASLRARQQRELELPGNGEVAGRTELEIMALEKKIQKEKEAEIERAAAEKKRNEDDVNRASASATEEGLRREEEAKTAAQRQANDERQAAEKKQQLDLTIALNEAIASGNKEEAEKVRWMQEYLRLQQQGESEEDARRAANASSGARAASAADSAERQLTAEKGITQEQKNRHTAGAVTGAIDQKIDLTRPGMPQTDFQAEFNRPIIPPVQPGQPPQSAPQQPAALTPSQPSQSGTQSPGSSQSADAAAKASEDMLQAQDAAFERIHGSFSALIARATAWEARFAQIEAKIQNLKAG